jgi:hypothetical protein
VASDWFGSKYVKPLVTGKNIVRAGKEPAQYTSIAAALSDITDPSDSDPYAINSSFTAYTDSTSGSSSATGLASAASMAFQVHANVSFAAKSAGGSTKPLDNPVASPVFAPADFSPGGAVGHLMTPVNGTAGLDGFLGLVIYDTSDNKLKYWDGAWKTVQTA